MLNVFNVNKFMAEGSGSASAGYQHPARQMESSSLIDHRKPVSPAAPGGTRAMERGLSRLRVHNLLARQLMAEYLGTTILLTLGDGSVAQSVLSRQTAGQTLSINIAWGIAVALAVTLSAETSGAHLNPAITLTQLTLGNSRPLQAVLYMLAQYAGAFTGAAVVYVVYAEALTAFDGGTRLVDGVNGTAGIFATYPQPYLTWYGGLVDQIVGTGLLCCLVMAVTDAAHAVPKYAVPGLVGLIVAVIGMSYGFNCGYAINPARDLGPRLFTLVAGWGSPVFSYASAGAGAYSWFWVPVAGPYLGAPLGALLYKLLIGSHHPAVQSGSGDTKL